MADPENREPKDLGDLEDRLKKHLEKQLTSHFKEADRKSRKTSAYYFLGAFAAALALSGVPLLASYDEWTRAWDAGLFLTILGSVSLFAGAYFSLKSGDGAKRGVAEANEMQSDKHRMDKTAGDEAKPDTTPPLSDTERLKQIEKTLGEIKTGQDGLLKETNHGLRTSIFLWLFGVGASFLGIGVALLVAFPTTSNTAPELLSSANAYGRVYSWIGAILMVGSVLGLLWFRAPAAHSEETGHSSVRMWGLLGVFWTSASDVEKPNPPHSTQPPEQN